MLGGRRGRSAKLVMTTVVFKMRIELRVVRIVLGTVVLDRHASIVGVAAIRGGTSDLRVHGWLLRVVICRRLRLKSY